MKTRARGGIRFRKEIGEPEPTRSYSPPHTLHSTSFPPPLLTTHPLKHGGRGDNVTSTFNLKKE